MSRHSKKNVIRIFKDNPEYLLNIVDNSSEYLYNDIEKSVKKDDFVFCIFTKKGENILAHITELLKKMRIALVGIFIQVEETSRQIVLISISSFRSAGFRMLRILTNTY